MKKLIFVFAGLTLVGLFSFILNDRSQPEGSKKESVKLSDYWYQGQAEVSTYTLQQNRYDNVHPGQAILIHVTENFLPEKQVKDDQGDENSAVPIIKTNLIERFTTGIYDYSMMTSVFTEVGQQSKTLKVTHSSQDWCGQSFSQINRRNKSYVNQLFSYFESEGDRQEKEHTNLLEDELLNLIRISPKLIPLGKTKIIPSAKVRRLLHLSFQAVNAEIGLDTIANNNNTNINTLSIEYPSLNRSQKIFFEEKMPYKILGWEDSYPSVFDKEPRTTRASLENCKLIDYWAKNGLNDSLLRDELRLN